jgi:hypothetical protein
MLLSCADVKRRHISRYLSISPLNMIPVTRGIPARSSSWAGPARDPFCALLELLYLPCQDRGLKT